MLLKVPLKFKSLKEDYVTAKVGVDLDLNLCRGQTRCPKVKLKLAGS